MFDTLFSPIKINSVDIKNRIAYPSLGLLFSLDGKINDKYINFYQERAKGGAGIVTVGPVGFNIVGSGPVALQLGSDDAIPDFKNLATLIKNEGARAWIQLFHAGAYSYSEVMGGETPVAPSAVYSNYSKSTPREMTLEDIKATQEEFVQAGRRAKEAGFDGVEIIASAGYLITQFLSTLKNKREDEYGGSFENRIRFPREVIEMMRKELGPDYPVTIRMAGNDFVPGSTTASEMPQIAKVYEKAGIDLINVTGGWHESRIPQLPMTHPRGVFSYLSLNIKREVNVPVMASNRITDPYLAEQILKDDIADMVNLGRVLIADPQWPLKSLQGRIDEIRPCVACNQGCTDELFSGRPVTCLANAQAGFEGERIIAPVTQKKKIMVVGAGPAGLEAAVRGAESGHDVELYDKSDDIGGQLWIAGTPPHKSEIWEIVRYYETMLDKYQIDVYLETEVDLELIKEKNPDHIILAEGAEIFTPPIDGMDDGEVFSAWDILKNDPKLGKKIAVIGGGAVGLETAHFLALKGTITPEALHFLFTYEAENVERLRELITKGNKDITVFEMLPKVGKGVGKSTKWILLGDIERHGVNIIPEAKVLSVKDGAVVYEKGGKEEKIEFDNVVNAVGSKSVRKLADSVDQLNIPYSVIGDSVRPAQISDAIHEALLTVLKINSEC